MLFSEWYNKPCIHKNWQSYNQIKRGTISAKELPYRVQPFRGDNCSLIPYALHYTDCGIIDTTANISDYKATFILIPFDYEIQNSYTRLIQLYKRANFEELRFQLRTYKWNCLSEGSLHEACLTFTNIFLDMVKSCIPSKQVTVRPDDKPWYS